MISEEDIPDHWEMKTIDDVIESSLYGCNPTTGEDIDGVPYLRISDVSEDGGLKYQNLPENAKFDNEEDRSKYLLSDGDIVIARSGASSGQSYVYEPEHGEMVYASYLIRFTLDRNEISKKYMRAYLKSPIYWGQVSLAKRGAAQDNINAGNIKDFKIPVPSLQEQQQVVKEVGQRLTTVNKLKRSVERLGAMTQEYEYSLLAFLFAGKKDLTSEGPESIPTEDDIPDHWELKTVEEICGYIQRGKQPDYDDENGRVKIINQRCIYWDGLRLENTRRLDRDHEEKWQDYRYLQEGDVLVNSTGVGTLGRAQIWDVDTDDDYVVDGHVTILRTDDEVKSEYLYQFLKSPIGQAQIEQFTRGSTGQTELYKKHITSIAVPVPPLDEQNSIIEKVEDVNIDRVNRAVEDVTVLFEEYRSSVLAHAFSHTPTDNSFSSSEQVTLSEI